MTDPDVIAEAVAERLGELIAGPAPLYSVNSLAERLSMSPRTVREMLRTGVIPSFMVEGARRIDPADVDGPGGYIERAKAAS